jgi:hypothetical protein
MVREHDRGTVESCDRYFEQLVDMMEPISIFQDSCFRPYTLQKGRNQMTTTTPETGRPPTDMVFFFVFVGGVFWGRNFTIFQQRN